MCVCVSGSYDVERHDGKSIGAEGYMGHSYSASINGAKDHGPAAYAHADYFQSVVTAAAAAYRLRLGFESPLETFEVSPGYSILPRD